MSMLAIGSIVGDAAFGTGFMAAAIAVCGFMAHAHPVLTGKGEEAVRVATVVGGLVGLGVSALVTLGAAFAR